MFDKKIFSFLLERDKDTISKEEFIKRFYVKAEYYKLFYEDKKDEFDILLSYLYDLDIDTFHKWCNTLHKIAYTYVKKNLPLITKLAKTGDYNRLQTAFDMFKKSSSLITRYVPSRDNYQDIMNIKKTKKELTDLIFSIRDNKEDSPLPIVQKEFEKTYKDIKDDEILSGYYNELYNGFEDLFKEKIKHELDKLEEKHYKVVNANVSYNKVYPLYNKKYKK